MVADLRFSEEAEKQKAALPQRVQGEIDERMRRLADDPSLADPSGIDSFGAGQYGTFCHVDLYYEFDEDQTELNVVKIDADCY